LGVGEVDGEIDVLGCVHEGLDLFGRVAGLGRVGVVVAGLDHCHELRVLQRGVLAVDVHAQVERRTQPERGVEVIKFVGDFGVLGKIVPIAGLHRNRSGVDENAVLPIPVLENDVEVAPSVGEIEVPDLDCESEGRVGSDVDDRGGRVLVLNDLGGGGDGGEVEGAEDHACEPNEDSHYDAQRDDTAGQRLVLQFGVIAQHLGRVEEVSLEYELLEGPQNFHGIISSISNNVYKISKCEL